MSTIQYFRHIVFRDKDLTRWEVDIEVRPAQMMRNENGKWVYYDGPIEVSFSGSGGRGCGQIVDHINPRTKFQQLLKEYWNRYHCICQNRQPLPDNYIILFNDLCNCIELMSVNIQLISPMFLIWAMKNLSQLKKQLNK